MCVNSIICLYMLMHDIIFDPSVYVPSTGKVHSSPHHTMMPRDTTTQCTFFTYEGVLPSKSL